MASIREVYWPAPVTLGIALLFLYMSRLTEPLTREKTTELKRPEFLAAEFHD